ncbi:putative uncharacterized protein [Eggerthella sp. CAG:298]|nr:putative uncharacterized protein [Eggerthella sp. CAG:298]
MKNEMERNHARAHAPHCISVTRAKDTNKPRIAEYDLSFFSDEKNDFYLGIGGSENYRFFGHGRSLVREPPYRSLQEAESGRTIHLTSAQEASVASNGPARACAMSERYKLDYRFIGGYDNNALEVYWDPQASDPKGTDQPTWIAIKTYAGMQLKYVKPGEKPPIIFAFAQEDAYCYCNYSPCKDCVFRCKFGFKIYYHFEQAGLIGLPCNRIVKE